MRGDDEVGPGWSEALARDARWLALRGPLTLLHVRRVRAALGARDLRQLTLDGEAIDQAPCHTVLLVLVEQIAAHIRAGGRAGGRPPNLIPPRHGPEALAWHGLAVLLPELGATRHVTDMPRPTAPPPPREAALFAVRRQLAREPRRTVRDVALRLGRPADGLERELRGCGTTFAVEQRAARLGRATELLMRTSLKVEAVAREVGFASKPSFIAGLRDLTGLAPGALRETLGEASDQV